VCVSFPLSRCNSQNVAPPTTLPLARRTRTHTHTHTRSHQLEHLALDLLKAVVVASLVHDVLLLGSPFCLLLPPATLGVLLGRHRDPFAAALFRASGSEDSVRDGLWFARQRAKTKHVCQADQSDNRERIAQGYLLDQYATTTSETEILTSVCRLLWCRRRSAGCRRATSTHASQEHGCRCTCRAAP
jgi:hypothetical protein